MADQFDLIVLGSGVAGGIVADRCRRAGWRVVIIDERPLGGTCALRGCEPKKVLWTLAEAADRSRRLAPVGLCGGDAVSIDWPALQRFKRSFTDPVPKRTEQEFAEAGIAIRHGHARFVARDAVQVNDERLTARHILIATGAAPRKLPIEGQELLATSTDFLDLSELPRRIVLVGGGYIAFEFAHIARRAGADVTILHQNDKPLAPFDRQLVARLLQHTRNTGIKVELNTAAHSIARNGSGVTVHAKRNDQALSFDADLAVHAAGRAPDLDGLDLDAAGIERDGKRLKLDRVLRSASNPAVFAAGDAASAGPPLTPVASIDAEAIVSTLLMSAPQEPDYRGVPSVVFSIPPLTSLGLTEEAARQKGLAFDLHEGDMAEYQSVRRLRSDCAAFRVLIEKGSERLLGAHLLGPNAEEVINLFALAMRLDVRGPDLRRFVSAYPSFGSNLGSMLS